MNGPAGCEVIGRWRIVAADLWDRDYLDLAGSAYFQIGAEGWAEFAFGAVGATAELEYGQRIVFFRWSGFDEGDQIAGGDRPSCRTTALSKSSCPSMMATMRPSPHAANNFFNSLLEARMLDRIDP